MVRREFWVHLLGYNGCGRFSIANYAARQEEAAAVA